MAASDPTGGRPVDPSRGALRPLGLAEARITAGFWADRQRVIPSMPLEDLLDTDHQARLVWAFCAGLDLAALYDSIRARQGRPGHPAIDPRLCVALWLYATLEGVGSARALAGRGRRRHRNARQRSPSA